MKTRRAFEKGHHPKILVVVDNSPEFENALIFAARQARRFDGSVIGIAVIEPQEMLPFLGIGDRMLREAEDEATASLEAAAVLLYQTSDAILEKVMRRGTTAEEINRLIAEDEDIAGLVLAASTEVEGPGPLVSALASGGAAKFRVPITIIPGHLSRHEIEALA